MGIPWHQQTLKRSLFAVLIQFREEVFRQRGAYMRKRNAIRSHLPPINFQLDWTVFDHNHPDYFGLGNKELKIAANMLVQQPNKEVEVEDFEVCKPILLAAAGIQINRTGALEQFEPSLATEARKPNIFDLIRLRDQYIVALYSDPAETITTIATKFGLSKTRVRQVIDKWLRAFGRSHHRDPMYAFSKRSGSDPRSWEQVRKDVAAEFKKTLDPKPLTNEQITQCVKDAQFRSKRTREGRAERRPINSISPALQARLDRLMHDNEEGGYKPPVYDDRPARTSGAWRKATARNG